MSVKVLNREKVVDVSKNYIVIVIEIHYNCSIIFLEM